MAGILNSRDDLARRFRAPLGGPVGTLLGHNRARPEPPWLRRLRGTPAGVRRTRLSQILEHHGRFAEVGGYRRALGPVGVLVRG